MLCLCCGRVSGFGCFVAKVLGGDLGVMCFGDLFFAVGVWCWGFLLRFCVRVLLLRFGFRFWT